MDITKEEIYRTAKLAKLKVADSDFDSLQKDLKQILDFVETLNDLDCSNVEPLFGITTTAVRERKDEVGKTPDIKDLLKNANNVKHNMFAIKKFVE